MNILDHLVWIFTAVLIRTTLKWDHFRLYPYWMATRFQLKTRLRGGEGRLTIDGSYLSHQRSRPSLPTALARRLKQEKIPACHVKILPIKTEVTICLPIWRLGYHSRCPRSRHVSNETHRHWSSDSNSLGRGRRELEGSWWRHMPTRPGGSE